MKRKPLIISLISTCVAALSVFPILTMVNAFGLPSVYENTFLGEMKYKIKRLKETDGKRIILIGGSSVPFGVRSDLIEQYLPDYKVVDFGMYASLGSDIMLDFAKAKINKDDIVIFMPEQHEQTLSMFYNGSAIWQALDGDYQNYWLLPKDKRERLVGDLYKFSQDKYKYNYLEKIDVGDSIYQKSSFNDYGDIKVGLATYNTMYGLFDPTTLISFDTSVIHDDLVSYVNDFSAYINKKRATMFYYFAPANKLAKQDDSSVDAYYDYISGKFNFDILGNPNDSIMDPEWFYDTNFHLNDSGSIIYTKKLIQNIKLALNDTSVTDIDEPMKPEIPEEEIEDGDNSQADNFYYEETSDGLIITGIKSAAERMIIPFRVNGKRVIGFTEKVFKNRRGIREIFIQSNVRFIYDGSFGGCVELEKIHINNRKPSSINIGVNLLGGSNANIYVPQDLFGSYVASYNFGIYADRIKPE